MRGVLTRLISPICFLMLTLGAAAYAAEAVTPPGNENTTTKVAGSFVEFGGDYNGLSSGLGPWSGGYLRTVLSRGSSIWNGEINAQHEVGDQGVYTAVGDTYT